MSVEAISLGILSTWGLSALLYYWSGFDWLRNLAGMYMVDEHDRPITFWGKQLNCFWCIAMWVCIPVAVLVCVAPRILLPTAFWSATMLLSKGGRIIWQEMIKE